MDTCTWERGTFTGKSLAPGVDNVYRLGGGSNSGYGSKGNVVSTGALKIEHGVLNGNASVKVGSMDRYGSGDVLLKSANSFSGTLTVQGHDESMHSGAGRRGSFLEGLAQTDLGRGTFGESSGSVKLINSTLKLTGVSGGKPVSKGTLSFDGSSTLSVDAGRSGSVSLSFSELQRNDRSWLRIVPIQEQLGEQEQILVSGWKNDMDLLPPYFLYCSPKPQNQGTKEYSSSESPDCRTMGCG